VIASRHIPWLRVFVEGFVIVGSILLAFAIDAWWTDRQARSREQQQLGVAWDELSVNQAELRSRRRRGASALQAQDKLIELIRPESSPISSDSLASLLRQAWGYGIAEVESGALDALLASGEFRMTARADLYRVLAKYRALLEDHRNEDRVQFIELRTRLLDYVGTVSPGAFVFDETDFPVPVEALLVDPQLEAIVSQLRTRTVRMVGHVDGLLILTDSAGVLLGTREAP
jgi:hypothetical protein